MNQSKCDLNLAMFSLSGSIQGVARKARKSMVEIMGIKKRPQSLGI